MCQEAHTINTFQRFARLPVEGRLETIKRNKLCHNCLAPRHAKDCNSTINCRHCQLAASLLHNPSAASPSPLASTPPPASTSSIGCEQFVASHFSMNVQPSGVILATTLVCVATVFQRLVVRALLDQKSTHTFRTAALAARSIKQVDEYVGLNVCVQTSCHNTSFSSALFACGITTNKIIV